MTRFILVLGLLVGLTAKARAQSEHGGAIGLTFDQYYAGMVRAHGVSFRGMGPGRLGVTSTFGAGFARDDDNPQAAALALDLGLGHQAMPGSASLLVEMGATVLFGEATGAIGGYMGVTLLVPVAGRVGARFGLSRRAYLPDGTVGLWLISVGVTTVSRRVPGPVDESVARFRRRTE